MDSTGTKQSVQSTLDSLAKKGKLPGFESLSAESFKVDAFGNPFDADIVATVRSTEPLIIDFELKIRRTMPLVFILVTLLTIWPGVLITDSLIPGEWGWWPTMYWYLPLTILPLPFVTRTIVRSTRTTTRTHAQKQIKSICEATGCQATGDACESPKPAQ